MFYKDQPRGYKQLMDGIQLKTMVYGEKTLFAKFLLDKGSQIPVHHHPYEQTGYLVSGKMQLTVGDIVYDVSPGDSWCIPENVAHCANAIEDSVAIEVFSPVRPDYLPESSTP